jgi:hypothetical protein
MSCVVNIIGRYKFWEKLEPTCHMSKARPNHLVRPALWVRSAWQVRAALPRGLSLV